MKKLFFFITLIVCGYARSQVTINLQLPPAGLSLRSQLWNMLVNNSSGAAMMVHAELRLNEEVSNRPVMTAVTGTVTLSPGNQFLQYSSWAPVQYNITDPSYQGFAATDFLPVGRFVACYTISKVLGDGHQQLVDECEVIDVEALSPPQLVYPANQDSLETDNPVFNWIAPAPANLFTAMTYDLQLTEMYTGQQATDAIQQNIPLFSQSGIATTSYPYSAGAAQLETGKKYAWRILAKNNDAVVARSETWWFTIKDHRKNDYLMNNELPFARLKKDNQLSYAIAENELKFEYTNETRDTTWNVRVFDISVPGRKQTDLSLDSIPLKTGQNLIKIQSDRMQDFTDKHIYLLQLRNSRDELWQLKFEYRRRF